VVAFAGEVGVEGIERVAGAAPEVSDDAVADFGEAAVADGIDIVAIEDVVADAGVPGLVTWIPGKYNKARLAPFILSWKKRFPDSCPACFLPFIVILYG